MKQSIQILGIAPYEGMKTIMNIVAAKHQEVNLNVCIADQEDVLDVTQSLSQNDYDIIISRGGTAEVLKTYTTIPVIEISLSVYDILRAIRLAENYNNRYAIIGYPSITTSAYVLCDLLQYQIDIYTINNIQDLHIVLDKLKKEDFQMVLGDMVTTKLAKSLGMNSILITSGYESIESAFIEAITQVKNSYLLIDKMNFYLKLLQMHETKSIVFSKDGEEVFCTFHDHPKYPQVITVLKNTIKSLDNDNCPKVIKQFDKLIMHATGRKITVEFGQDLFVFYIDFSPTESLPKGINFYNREEALDTLLSTFYDINNFPLEMQQTIQKHNKSNRPILIIGEDGTEKEQIAALIYTKSPYCTNPFCMVDCGRINDKDWHHFIKSDKTPLSDSNLTIFFKSMNFVSESNFNQLRAWLENTHLLSQNRLIFSYTYRNNQDLQNPIYHYLKNNLASLLIHPQALRNRSKEIPGLASVYINKLNINRVNPIIGFEPEALKLLQEYIWPCNFTEFRRVLVKLSALTHTSYILQDNVRKVMQEEAPLVIENNLSIDYSLFKDQTLEQINKYIIRIMLKQNNNNQTIVAKKLGISRTTLWRLLKSIG